MNYNYNHMSYQQWTVEICNLLADYRLMPDWEPVTRLLYPWHNKYTTGASPSEVVAEIIHLLRKDSP